MSARVNKLALAAMVTVLSTGMVGCKKQESSAELLAQAKQFQQKGDTNAAMIQLKNALQANPEDSEARYLLAVAYIDGGDAQAAEKEIRRAIALKYPADKTMPILARALNAQGKFKETLAETAEEAAKNAPELLVPRADAHMAQNQREDAKRTLEQALVARPDYGLALIGLGRLAFMDGDRDGALKLAEQAVAKEPGNADVLMFKADLLRAQRQTDQALAAYDQVLKLKPNHRTAHIEKAYLQITTGKFDGAQADLNAAKKTTPNNLHVLYTQALLDFAQGKAAAAQENLQKVLRAAPEHMPSILLAGAVALNLGSNQQAELHLKKFLESNPDNVYARKMLATTLLRGGQGTDALNVLNPALKADQPDVQILALAGESHMQARDFGKASEYFGKASQLAPQAAQLRTSLGLSKLGQGNQAQAISDLEAATRLDAKSPHAAMALVRAELVLKQYDKALAAIDAFEKGQPDNVMATDMKGLAYVGKREFGPARAAFTKALTLQPSYFPAVANLAQLDLLEKKPAQAKATLTAFLDKNKQSVEAMTALAALAGNERNIEEATRWLEQAQAVNPSAAAPALRLIQQYLLTKQPQKALTLARKAHIDNPDNPELMDALAKCQLASDDAAAALETYNKLVAAQPKSAPAQLQVASVQMRLKNMSGAEEHVKKALALQPDFPAAQMALAEIHVRKRQPEQALAIAGQLQKKYPDNAIGHLLEGEILLGQNKAAEAVRPLDKALALAPRSDTFIKTVSALRQAGRGAEADKRIDQWQQQRPQDTAVRMFKAELYLNDKKYKEAGTLFEAMLKDQPKNVPALNNLAYAYQQSKDPRALATAEEAYKLAGGVPAVMDTLGWILAEQGNVTRALPLLQKASTQSPDDRDIRYHLAFAMAKSGDKAGAKRELEQALAGGQAFTQQAQAHALLQELK